MFSDGILGESFNMKNSTNPNAGTTVSGLIGELKIRFSLQFSQYVYGPASSFSI